jgi:hypothetical protein
MPKIVVSLDVLAFAAVEAAAAVLVPVAGCVHDPVEGQELDSGVSGKGVLLLTYAPADEHNAAATSESR